MKRIVVMAAVAVCVMLGMDVNAQVVQRGDRRPVVVQNNNRMNHQQMKQVNMMKRQLQRKIMIARADGIITFREQRAIDRQKMELDRFMYGQRNMIVRR
jgi:hypothetical protein